MPVYPFLDLVELRCWACVVLTVLFRVFLVKNALGERLAILADLRALGLLPHPVRNILCCFFATLTLLGFTVPRGLFGDRVDEAFAAAIASCPSTAFAATAGGDARLCGVEELGGGVGG